MALFISRDALARQTTGNQAKKQPKHLHTALLVSACFGMLSLSACQTAPTSIKTPATNTVPSTSSERTSQPTTVTQTSSADGSSYEDVESTEVTKTNDNYPIEPYHPPVTLEPETESVINKPAVFELPNQSTLQTPIITQPDIIILAPAREDNMIYEPSIPSHNELLERARQNSQQRSQQSTTNNSNLPAFRNLMQVGTEQLKSGNITGAESSFTRAQRLAPKSSAVYFYLGQVALKKNQPRKAEAMARRGLTVAQDNSRRRALWQIILQSGQAQGNARVIREAKQALR
ncbi:MAG TPA: tetratricopeptide repeat protein [Psychrobacter sp.]|uniref:tetratricopeptide repeat protein n=1 Tax=Psychrobacter sp. TaxID=56811 RepID=UPI002CEF5D02|nr:tetratricopeptide repeat protein [Psychrobacter sp.]HSP85751.1 tetratricopeptide repeat protein [Psychrobacter sp.]